QKDAQAGQSREDFKDGEFRFRMRLGGSVSALSCGVREGLFRVVFYKAALAALGAGEHEVVLTCRGLEVSATLDGKPTPVDIGGKPPAQGRLQFNYQDEPVEFLSIEYRPLP
ncbi:MAG TPA: hypothetical protein VMU54_22350, partial [Planctomycetota bacterium]|nr:hypothetical protein [Planctomycetota bacterium]